MFATKQKYLYFFFVCFIGLIGYFLKPPKNPHAGLNVEELIRTFGYPLEVHQVETEDGYLLTLHRIPYGLNSKINNGIPVLLMHGVFQSSTEFVISQKSLGLLLADRGFDVWLGNSRGSTWSRKHVKFDPDFHSEFWNFTMQEMAVFDITAIIDHILNTTKQFNLHYIGYSQGVSQYIIALSERPEYNKKIRLMSALAPTVLVPDIIENFLIRNLISNVKKIETLFKNTGTFELFPPNNLVSTVIKFTCNGNYLLMHICLFCFKMIQGGINQVDKALLPIIASNMPSGIGAKHFLHILQVANRGFIQKYDYGKEINIKVYGQQTPSRYELHKLTAPISIYYSKNDQLVNIKSVKVLNQLLPNVVKNYLIPIENFHHIDFLIGKDVNKILYSSVIDEMIMY